LRGVAEFYSSLIIVAIVLSISYLIYSEVPPPNPSAHPLFRNTVYEVYGPTRLIFLGINSSLPASILDFDIDQSSSAGGILALEGSFYTNVQSLCVPGGTTFFSIYSPTSGTLSLTTNGRVWIDGQQTTSAGVKEGWHELVIAQALNCLVVLPGGKVIGSVGTGVSSIPLVGVSGSAQFFGYLPYASGRHRVEILFKDGIDSLEIA